jgi:hypothetical protein
VKKYFNTLVHEPHLLHNFYADDANFSFYDGVEDREVVTGIDAIKETVQSLNLNHTTVDLTYSTLDAQYSGSQESIFLTVTGHIEIGSSSRCVPFLYSFFLVRQKKEEISYLVSNGVFRVLRNDFLKAGIRTENVGVSTFSTDTPSELVMPGDPPVSISSPPATLKAAPVELNNKEKKEKDKEKKKEVTKPKVNKEDTKNDKTKEKEKDDVDEGKSVSKLADNNQEVSSNRSASASKGISTPIPAPPKSWAALAAANADKKPVIGNGIMKASVTTKKEDASGSSGSDTGTDIGTAAVFDASKIYSVYVKTTESHSKDDMVDIFKRFGKVINVQVFSTGFAFVDFSTPEELELCLSKGTWETKDGKPLVVEKRKSYEAPGTKKADTKTKQNNGNKNGGQKTGKGGDKARSGGADTSRKNTQQLRKNGE